MNPQLPVVRITDDMMDAAMKAATRHRYAQRFNGNDNDHYDRFIGFLGEYGMAKLLGHDWRAVNDNRSFDLRPLHGLADLVLDGVRVEVKTEDTPNHFLAKCIRGIPCKQIVFVNHDQFDVIKEHADVIAFGGIDKDRNRNFCGFGWLPVDEMFANFNVRSHNMFTGRAMPAPCLQIPIEQLRPFDHSFAENQQ